MTSRLHFGKACALYMSRLVLIMWPLLTAVQHLAHGINRLIWS